MYLQFSLCNFCFIRITVASKDLNEIHTSDDIPGQYKRFMTDFRYKGSPETVDIFWCAENRKNVKVYISVNWNKVMGRNIQHLKNAVIWVTSVGFVMVYFVFYNFVPMCYIVIFVLPMIFNFLIIMEKA